MSVTVKMLSRKQRIFENTILLYLKSLFLFFLPPILVITLIHKMRVITMVEWIPIWMAFLFPISSALVFIIDYLFLRNELIIYDLPPKYEKMLTVFKCILIKMLLCFLIFYINLRVLNIDNIDNRTVDLPIFLCVYFANYFGTDLSFYWSHRLMHKSKFLYRHIHFYHHQSLVTSVFTHYRMSLLEYLIPSIFLGLFNFMLYNSVDNITSQDIYSGILGYMLAFLHIEYIAQIGHSNREHSSYKIIKIFPFNILSTNVMHAMHHARLKCNYGAYSRIWDIVFKTLSNDYDQIFKRISEQSPLIKLSERVD